MTIFNQSPSRSSVRASRPVGFTVVEIVIVVVTIGIIAAIGIPAYQHMQRNAATGAVLNDLRAVTQTIERQGVRGESLPTAISEVANLSPDVQVVMVTSGAEVTHYYSNLTMPQNGLLFFEHCSDMVSEGLGNGPNDFGGNTIAYISGCHVYGKNYIQINGWNGGFHINNPNVTEELLQGYVATAKSNHPAHPSYHATLENFMNTLVDRFRSEGGSLPITEFWNPWQTVPTLPPPESGMSNLNSDYCLVATHAKHNDISYFTTSKDLTPRQGSSCD